MSVFGERDSRLRGELPVYAKRNLCDIHPLIYILLAFIHDDIYLITELKVAHGCEH
jgi:hypothetical protein